MCIFNRLIVTVFFMSLSACGGGGGDSAAAEVSTSIGDISGIWSVTETAKNHNCELNSDLRKYTLTVKQNGGGLTIIDEEGNSYSSTLKGGSFSWTGSYEEDAPDGTSGRINLNPMSASVEASCNKLSGTANWTWTATDGSGYSCSGTTNFSATRSMASGCGETTNDGITPPDDGSTPINTDTQAPSIPQIFKASSTSTTINIKWSASTDNVAVVGYSVFRGGLYLQEGAIVDSEKTVTYTDSGLTPSTQYCYTALAYDATGNESAQSLQQCVMTTAIVTVDVQAPTVPTNLKALAISSSQINLSWSVASDNVAVTSYNVYRDGGFTKSVTSNSASDIDLTASTNYCYNVLAKDAVGNSSAQSAQDCTFTKSPAVTIPAAPSNISASNITYNSAKITWNDNSDNETGFEVGTCSDSTATRTLTCSSGFNTIATVSVNTYTFISLQASNPYTYYVRSVNSAGVSANIQVKFTTADQVPVVKTMRFYATADNMIVVSSLNVVIANNYYDKSVNGVGCNWSYSVLPRTSAYDCSASLIYFDISSISGKNIISASLLLGVGMLPDDRPFYTYTVGAVFDDWYNTVTWNTKPRTYIGSVRNFSKPRTTVTPLDINVTSIVARWASGIWNNYGFMLEDSNYKSPDTDSLRATSFCSLETCGGKPGYRPQLKIKYE